jgi:DNA polymerase alpha subunit B
VCLCVGGIFNARRFILLLFLPLCAPSRPPLPLLADVHMFSGAGESGLSLVVAAGPFTVGQDMSYRPLEELLDYVTRHKPDVVILLGPFVDVDAPPVQDGTLDETFDTVFEKEVSHCIPSEDFHPR